MAMQRKLWSINGLSAELDTDRRTLAKRLQNLRPAETKRVGSRTEKRWYLQDVIEHLADNHKARRRGVNTSIDAEVVERFNQSITQELFPVVLAYFQPFMLDGLTEDYGLSEQQSRTVYGYSVVALSYAIQHALDGDDSMSFCYPDGTMEILKEVGDASRAAAATKRD